MTKVLLVEDDTQISKSLSISLTYSGFEVATADTVALGWSKALAHAYDIILLDVGLPDGSGLDLCQRIRTSPTELNAKTPILFLSAQVDEDTVVRGMNFGADDYIRKPFGTEELKVRMVKALARVVPTGHLLKAGALTIDLDKRSASISGRHLNLGKREFDILAYLAKKGGDVVTRENILEKLDEKNEVYDRTIDSHMSHLRRKLREATKAFGGDSAGDYVQIVAVYGVGYRLVFNEAPGDSVPLARAAGSNR